MDSRSRFVRISLLGAVLALSAGSWSIGTHATGTGQSFTHLAAPFTQDLYGASGDLLDPVSGILGGVAFAPNGDVWASECYFYGTRLHKFDSQTTGTVHGTAVHPETVVDISDVGPYGQSGVLPFGAGGCGLVNHPDGYIYSNSMFGIWKLDATTGRPVDPATNLPIDPGGAAPAGGGLVGGATAQPGNALGIAVDPQADAAQVHHLVYVGADCHPSLSPDARTCTLWDLNPATGVTQVFARLSRPRDAFVDGLYFDPSGQFVFAAYRDEPPPPAATQNSLLVIRRPAALQAETDPPLAANDGQLAQAAIPMASEPDGVAFHATQGFVVTLNESDDGPVKAGTMTRFDFPGADYTAVPTQTEFASGGFRGDLLQVGGDGCIYATQGQLFERQDYLGTRYDDGTTTTENSLVQICGPGGFALPPGVHPQGNSATPNASVSGLVYADTNHNGVHDAGEPGIGGVTVTLAGGAGGTTVTAADGTYAFTALSAGAYALSSPAAAAGLQLFTASPLSFTLAAAETKTDQNFGYVSGSLAGVAYVDANRNGARDAGEPGIPNVLITLAGASGATALTGADGSYKFNLLSSGAYTSAAPATAAGKALGTPSPLAVTLALGEDRTDVNFGYVSGAISGFAYVDTNRNGVHDSGEPGIGGVVMTLTGGAGGTTTTAADGSYTFTNLDAGTYSVSAPATASGKGLETPSPLSVDVVAGQTTPEVSFGYVPGSLSGFVYVDSNRNSVRDAGEPGIGSVVVTGPGGATTTTAADGSYSFTNLDAGTYSVSAPATASGKALETASPLSVTVTAGQATSNVNFGYVPGSLSGFVYVDSNRNSVRDAGEPGIGSVVVTGPGGATTTTAADGSYSFSNLDAGTYSVSAPATASGKARETMSPLSIAVTAGQNTPNVNFGYVPGGLSGYVYVDANHNGVRDSGEAGILGVVVTLTGGPGGTATTAFDGSYSFPNLDAGSYSVSSPAIAGGKALSTPSPLTPSVTAGQTTPNVNFGYVPGALSGFVYLDTNRNSVRDAGEPGIGGVVVTGPGGTATTAADGSYSFVNLNAGSYSVSAPASAGGNGLETPSPLSASVTAGQTTPNVNFGYVSPLPALSLTKTANVTTYSYVGQTIVYTYVIHNTGNVTVSGPFTVTDDKLGAFQCGTATSLAGGASLTCTKSYVIQASDLGNVTALPTGVGAMIYTGTWLGGLSSTQDTTVSGAAPGVPDGVYPGWCIQDHVAADLHNQAATLYSTVGGGLPSDVANLAWHQINYVLNHKIRGAGKTDLAFFKDVQTAIWLLLGEPNPDFGVSAEAQQMVNDANAHPTFVPGSADIVAVIVYSDGMGTAPGSIQESIIEMKPQQSITNHAAGAGQIGSTPVTSNQAQVTVNQIIQTTPTPSGAQGQSPAVDRTVFADGGGPRSTKPFSTSSAGEVLLAFVASDGPSSGGQQITVSGAGLTWTLVKRANAQLGTSEIWKAFATGVLTNVTVTATQKFSSYHLALTVVSFTGATGVGASNSGSASSGAPTSSLTTTKPNSFVYGVGNDWDHVNGRVLGPNQIIVHQWIDNETGDTHWVQARAAGVPAAGTLVQLNDTAPTADRWNFAIVEVIKN